MLSVIQEVIEKRQQLDSYQSETDRIELEQYLQEAAEKAEKLEQLLQKASMVGEYDLVKYLPLSPVQCEDVEYRLLGQEEVGIHIQKNGTIRNERAYLLSPGGEVFVQEVSVLVPLLHSGSSDVENFIIQGELGIPDSSAMSREMLELLLSALKKSLIESVEERRRLLAEKEQALGYEVVESEPNVRRSRDFRVMVEDAVSKMMELDKREREILLKSEVKKLAQINENETHMKEFYNVLEEFISAGFYDSVYLSVLDKEFLPFNAWGLIRSRVFPELKILARMYTGQQMRMEVEDYNRRFKKDDYYTGRWKDHLFRIAEVKLFLLAEAGELFVANIGVHEFVYRDNVASILPIEVPVDMPVRGMVHRKTFPPYLRTMQPDDLVNSKGESIAPFLSQMLVRKAREVVEGEERLVKSVNKKKKLKS